MRVCGRDLAASLKPPRISRAHSTHHSVTTRENEIPSYKSIHMPSNGVQDDNASERRQHQSARTSTAHGSAQNMLTVAG